ncbi:DNA glycosylase AlkZ-like family protein [Pedococcus bigeumensis]|uniref:DNA glycosylase AlkZ-like family protein n=1 Tax=Pedococcus bigeumensis TaxID=433644 RepID=UPI002FE9EF41
MGELRLSRAEARRIAVRAQLLDDPRPTGLLDVVRRLGAVQVDLTAAVAPSADLVCWSRLGAGYALGELDDLFQERAVVELKGFLRPAEDIALFRAEMAQWPGVEPLRDWQMDVAEWVSANDECRLDILDQLESEAPLPARRLPDSCVVPWRSTGWTNNKNTQRMLDFMEARGEVAVATREGRERQWDLARRVYPDATGEPEVPAEEAVVERGRRRLAALGVARAKAVEASAEPSDVGSVGEAAVIEGLRGQWRVDPAQLDRLSAPFHGRTVLLSPLDRLVFDRKRMTELFDYDYQLEMYKPVAKRRWGYWAMPILHDDRLVGKLDATADHAAGVLRVAAVHEDAPFSPAVREAVDHEVAALAAWLGLTVAR